MTGHRRLGGWLLCTALVLALAGMPAHAEKPLIGKPTRLPDKKDNTVERPCLRSPITPDTSNVLERAHPWGLPKQALAEGFQQTKRILVLRYNFQYEAVDDPNTTGRGRMNVTRVGPTAADSQAYYDRVGHWVDPPPHNADYFDAHLKALNLYWNHVSEGHLNLNWDIYPRQKDSAFTLPHQMSYYGKCDSVVVGLERYFVDAIHLADSVSQADPTNAIDFNQYDVIFLFHAGSDRQNDVATQRVDTNFAPTCSDLFTGYIKFGDSIRVHTGKYLRSALLVPETACQDNRATALNAVLAHEFGHALGLLDLYSTNNFMSQLGDFSLMDDNGFGTGVDFGFKVGTVFGAIPVYPDAWSRAYLGYVPVYDFRKGTDIRVAAAEVQSAGIQIARVPVSENVYYLIENRCIETDDSATYLRQDSLTDVFLGPAYFKAVPPNRFEFRYYSGEYDYLLPGSGMLIYLVDEGVLGMDYDGDGKSNFEDNQVQWDPKRRFVTLMEADGLVNFGGFYRAGFGSAADMWREDRHHEFTPNTNPPSIDNTGNNTHVFVTKIHRDTVPDTSVPMDTVMRFDADVDKLASGFPARVGRPLLPLSPLAADLNGDGQDELVVASGHRLSVISSDGRNFLLDVLSPCATCPRHIDTAVASVHGGEIFQVPEYADLPYDQTTIPVVGSFDGNQKLIALGYPQINGGGRVTAYLPVLDSATGLAQSQDVIYRTTGAPLALSFGSATLWALTDAGWVYHVRQLGGAADSFNVASPQYDGISQIGNRLVVMAGDPEANVTSFFLVGDTLKQLKVRGSYYWGPVVADVNRDGTPEVVGFAQDGTGIFVSVDTASVSPQLSVLTVKQTGYHFTTNPIVGDVDNDGNPDIIIGGIDRVYAFDQHLNLKADFPVQVDDRYPNDSVITAPVNADVNRDGRPEVIFPTGVGNVYSFGPGKTAGFPLAAGINQAGMVQTGSPVIFHDSSGTKLGYVGTDGWFYAWNMAGDTTRNFWPMAGHDASGTFAFKTSQLSPPKTYADLLPRKQFYNYPNPVTVGSTTFNYFLGKDARRVTIDMYDLSGKRVGSLDGTTHGGEDNRVTWQCADVTPGVYRCRIVAEFDGDTETAFTDVAIIR